MEALEGIFRLLPVILVSLVWILFAAARNRARRNASRPKPPVSPTKEATLSLIHI
mgnify:CR=1 FL=1